MWRFADTVLLVSWDPPPARSSGSRKIEFSPPGYDGISATIGDGRFPATIALTVVVRTYAEYAMLSALFDSGASGDLEVPENDDAWIYEDAYVLGQPQWEIVVPGELWRCRVEFRCPNPRPVWKSTGLKVY